MSPQSSPPLKKGSKLHSGCLLSPFEKGGRSDLNINTNCRGIWLSPFEKGGRSDLNINTNCRGISPYSVSCQYSPQCVQAQMAILFSFHVL